MTYAHRQDIFDADSHMMEPSDWLARFAAPSIRGALAPYLEGDDHAHERLAAAEQARQARKTDPALARITDEAFMTMRYKGFEALGAWDRDERRHVNDLLGFQESLMFPTTAFNQVLASPSEAIFHGAVTALNQGLAHFCEGDPRLRASAYIPLGAGPDRALEHLQEALHQSAGGVLIDTIAPLDGQSFTHPAYDCFWAAVEASGLPLLLHVGVNGGYYDPVPASFYANGRTVPEPKAGDAPRDALAYMSIGYNAQLFLSAMIFDGVLDRFKGLRIGVVELGAVWFASWVRQLDQAHRAFKRLQDLPELAQVPSAYAYERIKITPFAGEPIGWMLAQDMDEVLMFASDYPHHEGTDDPIGRFERAMPEASERQKDRFYRDNYKALFALS